MIEHNFHRSLEVGSDGERIIFEFLKTTPSIIEVADVVADPDFRLIDVDFVVTTRQDAELYYELKTEPTAYDTKNFFFETISNETKNTVGCFLYSQADYWMSFIPQTGDVFIFPLDKCREYVAKESKHKQLKRVQNEHYYSRGYALPIVDVCRNVPHNHKNMKDYVDYEYIPGDLKAGRKPEFRNVIWK